VFNFRIIPVIDILNSKAVHARKGERAKYKPLKSILIDSSEPIEIVKFLNQKFKFKEFYIADLDAIIKKKPNLVLLTKILKIPEIDIILDPGIRDSADLVRYSKFKLKKLILGIETINSFDVINEALKVFGKNRIIVSIDMFNRNLISKIEELESWTPIDLINRLKEFSVQEIILLDLFRVGQKIGGIPKFYLDIRSNFKGTVLVGGGIKNFEDLQLYYNHNFSGVLIATALYDGSINVKKLLDSKFNQ
jgi:phosphoribosylformimino-5-aminoimidazole carboxamide ribotide isomerase